MSFIDGFKRFFTPKNATNVNVSTMPMFSLTGESVSPDSAMRQSAVYACVNLISETLASLPIKIYKTNWIDDRVFLPDHNLFYLLNFRPNAVQSGAEWKSLMAYNLVLNGQAFSYIQKDIYGRPTAILPLDNASMSVTWNADKTELLYYVGDPLKMSGQVFTQNEIMHFRGLSKGIIYPLAPVAYGSKSIGLDQALSKHQESSFGPNSTRNSAVLESPNPVNSETAKRILELFRNSYSGASNAGKVMFLDSGISYKPVTSNTNIDMQLIENKEASLTDICRFFHNVPPALIGYNRFASYASVESNVLHFLNFSMKPILSKFAQTLSRDLLKENDVLKYEIAFDYSSMLSGGMDATASYITKLVQGGIISPNEARAILGKDAMESEACDQLFIQQNMVSVDQMSKQAEQKTVQQESETAVQKNFAEQQIKILKGLTNDE